MFKHADAYLAGEPSQIPSNRFSTARLPVRQQLAAWRTTMGPLFDIASLGPPEDGFLARMVAWDLGKLNVIRCQQPAGTFERGRHHLAEGTPDHWVLFIPLDGTMTIETRLGRRTISAGGLGVCSLQQELRGSTTAITLLCINVSRDLCPEAAAIMDPSVNTIVRSSLGGLLIDHFINLEARLPLMTERHLPAIVETTRTMILSCIVTGEEDSPTMQAMLFERARTYIRRNLGEPELGVEELCHELGLSRSSLYRLFEAQGGVVQYIRSCRLIDAHRAFESGRDPRHIHVIAAESGFHDPAAFSRAFKRKFGYSPSEVRSKLHVHA